MNQSKDNLEDFFQQSFNDMEKVNQPTDWNSPSEAVWGKIQDGLTEERKLNVLFFKWPWSAIAASYLLMVGGYQFFQKNTHNEELSTAVVVEERFIDEVIEMVEVQNADEFISVKKQDKFRQENINKLGINSSINGTHSLQSKEYELLVQGVDNQFIIKNKKTIFRKGNGAEEPVFIPTLENQLTTNTRSLTISNDVALNPQKSKNYLAVSYGSVIEKLRSNSSEYTSSELAKGKNISMQIGRENEKGWGIETGIQYTKMEARMIKLADAENLKTTSKTYLEVPISVKKRWKKKQLAVSVKTGLVNRFEINQRAQSNGTPISDNNLQPNKYLPSVLASVGLEYFIQPNLSVYVEPTIAKGLKPVISFNDTDLRAENLMVQVGVRYEL